MRVFAFLVALLLVLWAVDAVVYGGRYTGEVYQGIHKQGQKLRAEVKTRLTSTRIRLCSGGSFMMISGGTGSSLVIIDRSTPRLDEKTSCDL